MFTTLYDLTTSRAGRPDFSATARLLKLTLAATNPEASVARLFGPVRALQSVNALGCKRKPIRRLLIDSVGESNKGGDFFRSNESAIGQLCAHCAGLALYSRQLFGPPMGTGFRSSPYVWATAYMPTNTETLFGEYTRTFPWMNADPIVWAASNPNDAALWPTPNTYWLHEDGDGACDLCGYSGLIIREFSMRGGTEPWPNRSQHPCMSYADGEISHAARNSHMALSQALHHIPLILINAADGCDVRWFSSYGQKANLQWMEDGTFVWDSKTNPHILDIYTETQNSVATGVREALYGKFYTNKFADKSASQRNKWAFSTYRMEVVQRVETELAQPLEMALAGNITLAEFYQMAHGRGRKVYEQYAEMRRIETHGAQYSRGLAWYRTGMKKLRESIGLDRGQTLTPAKQKAARENGKKGGRRPSIDWPRWDAKIWGNVAQLANEIGCTPASIYTRRKQIKSEKKLR